LAANNRARVAAADRVIAVTVIADELRYLAAGRTQQ
jgi:hypothetical protein